MVYPVVLSLIGCDRSPDQHAFCKALRPARERGARLAVQTIPEIPEEPKKRTPGRIDPVSLLSCPLFMSSFVRLTRCGTWPHGHWSMAVIPCALASDTRAMW